jgi:hypothetical protein
MASTYSALKIELIGTGEQTGAWGTTTNTNLGTALEEAITGSADVTFSSGTVTLTLTNTNASQTARNLRLNLTGTSGGAQNLIVPAIEKQYIVYNGCADTITIKNSTGTGVAVPSGKSMIVYNNGTNVVDAVTNLSASGTGVFDAGTVSAPSITFVGDTNTGIYSPAADTIGFTEGGVEALRLNANGQTSTSISGTASLPSFTRTGDENTGIFFPAADTIAFTEGGVESMRIDSSGNVGIGTVSPSAKLHVVGNTIVNNGTGANNSLMVGTSVSNSGTGFNTVDINGVSYSGLYLKTGDVNRFSIFQNISNSTAINTLEATPLTFGTNDTERMRIDSAGNVGIGTSSPLSKLDITSSNGTDPNADAASFLRLTNTATGSNSTSGVGFYASLSGTQFQTAYIQSVANFNANADSNLAFGTRNTSGAATERMRITEAGNIGIGTAIAGAYSPSLRLGNGGSGGGVVTATLSLGSYGTGYGSNLISSSDFTGSSASYLAFGTTPSGASGLSAPVERMRIDSAGNVGIGTSSPAAKTEIAGTAAGAPIALRITNTATDGYSTLNLGDGNGALFRNGSTQTNYAGANSLNLGTIGAHTLGFITNNNLRAVIDSIGNLAISSASPAWGYAGNVTTSGSGRYFSSVGDDIRFGANVYNDGSVEKYAATGNAELYRMANGTHQWYYAASGSANATISFSEAMRIDSSGNLLVGTTTSSGKVTATTAVVGSGSTDFATKAFAAEINFSVVNKIGAIVAGYDGPTIYGTAIGFSYNGTGYDMQFATNDNTVGNPIERMRITSAGSLLVGVTNDNARLCVQSSSTNDNFGTLYVVNENTADAACTAAFVTGSSSSSTSNVYIKFGINFYAAGGGQINANGGGQAAFGSFSDSRLKENIEDLPPQLANIIALRPVEFDYIESEGGGHQTGFIAQEMQAIYPDAVGERSDGMLTVTGWDKTTARLVKAIQEQQALITSLTARIAALESK